MEATLAQLAELVSGELHGDGNLVLCGASPLCDAETGHITMLDRVDRLACLEGCRASAILAPVDLVPNGRPLIRVDNVHSAFARSSPIFDRDAPPWSEVSVPKRTSVPKPASEKTSTFIPAR